MPNFLPLHKKTKIGRCTIKYYAGYVARKVNLLSAKFKCDTCKNNLLLWGNSTDTDFIELREYTKNLFVRPGDYLTFIVSRAVPMLYYLIPRLAGTQNISVALKEILIRNVDFKPINCLQHDLKTQNCNFLIKCALYFWCKKVNRICNGQELKFIKNSNRKNVDPIKLRAYEKWEKRRKFCLKTKK